MIEFSKLISEADYITIHIPKTAETSSLIGDKEFDKMKKTVRLVNCARGGIIDEQALIRALEAKKIAGCALDVYEVEPPDFSSALFKFDNCICLPHLGASTSEAQVNVAVEIAETVRDALLGKGIINAANFPSVNAEAYKTLEPYINLATRLGKFAGQLVQGRVSEVKIIYSGVVTQYKVAPVTLSTIYGILSPIMGETVNFINALDLAKERAINVQEIISSTEEEYVNCIKLEVKSDKETFVVWGILSGNKKPRIVKINDVYVETVPDGYMIFINNNDKPGLVGAIGTLLGQMKVNIAAISLGRESQSGVAISVVNVDSAVKEEVLEKLRATKDILLAKVVKV
jgi:D-3-phosphoglycerate dehydrogenase